MEFYFYQGVEKYTRELTTFYKQNNLDEKKGLEFAAKYWNSTREVKAPLEDRKRSEVPEEIEETGPPAKRVNPKKLNKCIAVKLDGVVCGIASEGLYCKTTGHGPKDPKAVKPPKEIKAKTVSTDEKRSKSKGREMNSKQPSKDAVTAELIKKRINSLISKNSHGHLEHAATHFTFDPVTKMPAFYQEPDGTLRPLTETELDQATEIRAEFALDFRKNIYGNYEYLYEQTQEFNKTTLTYVRLPVSKKIPLVYNETTYKIVGIQQEDQVMPLTLETIDICKSLRLDFLLPDKLGEITKNLSSLLSNDDYSDLDEADEEGGRGNMLD